MSNATDTSIPADTLAQWRRDAVADAGATRAGSGYYPSARILRLLDELDKAAR